MTRAKKKKICMIEGDPTTAGTPTLCGSFAKREYTTYATDLVTCNQCLTYMKDDIELFINSKYEKTENPVEIHEEKQKKKKGRPKKKIKKDIIKPVRWTTEEWKDIEKTAETLGMKPGVMIRSMVKSQIQQLTESARPTKELGEAFANARKGKKK